MSQFEILIVLIYERAVVRTSVAQWINTTQPSGDDEDGTDKGVSPLIAALAGFIVGCFTKMPEANDSPWPSYQTEKQKRRPTRDPIVLATIGLFFVTAASAVIAMLQWNTLQKSDETNRVGLRPYISGVGIDVDTERYPLYWTMSVILENSGGTPPLEMQYVIRSAPELPLDPEDIFQHPSETDAFFGTLSFRKAAFPSMVEKS